MTNEEKILDILASMSTRMDGMSTKMDDTSARMDGMSARMDGMSTRMDDMSTRMDDMSTRMDDMSARMDDMSARMDTLATKEEVENEILKINIKIETDIETKLEALGEGHAAILEQLTPRTRIDDMENEIKFLKTVVFQMSDELQKLKKAQ